MARPVMINSLQAATLADRPPCRAGSIHVYNGAGAACFVQFFNTGATANVTLGTTVPDFQIGVPSATALAVPIPDGGLIFGGGLVVASTTAANGGTTSAAGVILSMALD